VRIHHLTPISQMQTDTKHNKKTMNRSWKTVS